MKKTMELRGKDARDLCRLCKFSENRRSHGLGALCSFGDYTAWFEKTNFGV